jgi:O-antigen/teichoic acid export membrane protein
MMPGLEKEEVSTNSRLAAQLPNNLAANIAYLVINVIIGLVLVPYFVSTLGVAAYGIIPLATSITGYVAIVVQSLNTAISRFLTVDLQSGEYGEANKTFNTAFFGLSGVILLMVPVVFVVAWVAPFIFNVPAGQESGVFFLFLGVFGSFLLRSWSGNFTVQLFAYNRLDLQNLVNITQIIVQTGLIILLFSWFGPNLAFVGAAYFMGAIGASVLSIGFARKICPDLHVSIYDFDRKRIKDLLGMGGWVVVNQIGALFFLHIDLIVVNLLFGATLAGEYAIALQLAVLLRAVAGVFSGVLTPTILTYYAQKKTDTLITVSKSAVKLMGLLMALPIGLMCGLAPQLLTVWVGAEFAFLWPLIVLLTIHLAVNLAVVPLFSINVAYNRVRVPGLVTFFMGIGNLGLAIMIPLFTGLGYYGVALAGAIVLTLKNTVFTPWYATRILGISAHTFTRSMLPGIVATVLVGDRGRKSGDDSSVCCYSYLAVVGIVVTITFLLAVWVFCLNRFERLLFASYLPKAFKRKII